MRDQIQGLENRARELSAEREGYVDAAGELFSDGGSGADAMQRLQEEFEARIQNEFFWANLGRGLERDYPELLVADGFGAIKGVFAFRAAFAKPVASAVPKKISLGIEDHLDDFSRAYGADSWKIWAKHDPNNFKRIFYDKLSDPNTEVLFNLDGVDVWGGVTRASRGAGGATDWELLQIRSNPEWWSRIKWIKDGKEVPNPFE